MAKQSVIIRVDGNSNVGLGHIYRGIALAEMLKSEFEINFVVKQNSTINPITDVGFNYQYLPEISILEEPSWFKKNIDNDSIIICDGYDFKTEYQKNIKKQGFKLVYVDDLVEDYMYADIIINHSPGIKKEDYKAEPYTKFALGLDYVILRPAFLEVAKQKRNITKIDTAFICFGGADPHDFTLKATKAFLKVNQISEINIVIGGAYQHKEIFLLKKNKCKINIYKNLSETKLVSVMQKCNIAIAPASSISYEICAVGVPLLCGYYVSNQKGIYTGLSKKKLIFPCEDFLNYNFDIERVINKVYLIRFNVMVNKQKRLFSRKGRLNKLIKEICN